MASRDEHCQECVEKLGAPFNEIHQLLDQFAHYPDMAFLKEHRKFLHHQEGIAYFKARYGKQAGEAARLHILRDCGDIPKAVDYYNGTVDCFGRRLT